MGNDMAALTETWLKLLDTLMKTFVFLRDVFGYFIPGAAFLALVYYDKLHPLLAAEPKTLEVLAVLGAAYCFGQVLVALGYRLVDTVDALWTVWSTGNSPAQNRRAQGGAPVDAKADELFYRYRFPGIFVENDRQDTIHITRIGLAMALIAAAVMHRYGLGPAHRDAVTLLWPAAVLVGLTILYNCWSNQPHHGLMNRASIAAAKKADDAKMPSPNGAPAAAQKTDG
jgi:amino acid transporter